MKKYIILMILPLLISSCFIAKEESQNTETETINENQAPIEVIDTSKISSGNLDEVNEESIQDDTENSPITPEQDTAIQESTNMENQDISATSWVEISWEEEVLEQEIEILIDDIINSVENDK